MAPCPKHQLSEGSRWEVDESSEIMAKTSESEIMKKGHE